MKYRVLEITNNPDGYPEAAKDSQEFPHMVKRVNDEFDLFIVDESGQWWPADEFFDMVDLAEFKS